MTDTPKLYDPKDTAAYKELEAERDRLRDARDLAYGLLWSISLDTHSTTGRAWSLARKALLGTMTKDDQARGIELARAALKGET